MANFYHVAFIGVSFKFLSINHMLWIALDINAPFSNYKVIRPLTHGSNKSTEGISGKQLSLVGDWCDETKGS